MEDSRIPVNEDNNNYQLLRIDKNIAKQGIDFIATYGNDGHLIFDIFLYLANIFQKNLFNFGRMEPNDFANTLGYHTSNLKRQHPDPLYLKTNPNEKNNDLGFTSVLENALYKASKYNLEFTRKVKDFTNKEEIKEIEFYQLISKLRKHQSTQRKDVFYYTFEISDTFTNHISKYFTVADINSIISLRKNNTRYLYLYIKVLEEAQKQEENKIECNPDFNILCEKANLNIVRSSDLKQKLKQKLDIIKEATDINFYYEFYNKYGKHNFGVKLFFPDNVKQLSDVAIKEKRDILDNAVCDFALFEAIKYYRSKYQIYGRLNRQKFLAWFYSGEEKQMKIDIFFNSVAEIKKISVETAQRTMQVVLNKFLNEYANKFNVEK